MAEDKIGLASTRKWALEFDLRAAATGDSAENHDVVAGDVKAMITYVAGTISGDRRLGDELNLAIPSANFYPDKIQLSTGELTLDHVHDTLNALYSGHQSIASQIRSYETTIVNNFEQAAKEADGYETHNDISSLQGLIEKERHYNQSHGRSFRKIMHAYLDNLNNSLGTALGEDPQGTFSDDNVRDMAAYEYGHNFGASSPDRGQGKWVKSNGQDLDHPSDYPDPLAGTAGTNKEMEGTGYKATDLGQPLTMNGEKYILCGDTFSGDGALQGQWNGPILFRLNSDGTIDSTFKGMHIPPRDTDLSHLPANYQRLLPGGIISDGKGGNYVMLVPVNGQKPQSSGLIYKIDSNNPFGKWDFITVAPPKVSQMAGYTDADGTVYMVSSGLSRNQAPGFTSFHVDDFHNINAWSRINPVTHEVNPIGGILNRNIGEMDMKLIDGETVFTYADRGEIHTFVAKSPEDLSRACETVFRLPSHAWPNDKNNLYAPYISDGKQSLNNLQIAVSNWNVNQSNHGKPYGIFRAVLHPNI